MEVVGSKLTEGPRGYGGRAHKEMWQNNGRCYSTIWPLEFEVTQLSEVADAKPAQSRLPNANDLKR